MQAGVTAELLFALLAKNRTVSDKKRNIFQSDYLEVCSIEITSTALTWASVFYFKAGLTFRYACARICSFPQRGVVDIAGDKILDDEGDAVMMEWERPLMQEHADWLCGPKSKHEPDTCAILNIGFGMGIFDSYVQSHRPKIHTIVEAHPAIQKKVIHCYSVYNQTINVGLAIKLYKFPLLKAGEIIRHHYR